MADERGDVAREKRVAAKRVAGTRARHERAEAKYRGVLGRLGTASVTEETVERLLRELTRATVLRLRAANELARLDQRLRQLDSDGECERRVRLATRLAREAAKLGDTEPSGRAAVEVVLLHAGGPLHYTEITRLALESGLIKTRGRTPKQTIAGYLARAVRDGDRFVRVDRGVFGLAERDGVAT